MKDIARFPTEEEAREAMVEALSDILLFRTWNWLTVEEQTEQTKRLSMEIYDPFSNEEADLAYERLEKAGFSNPDFLEVQLKDTDDMAIALEVDFILENK